MGCIRVTGGRPLRGTLPVQGAKNAVLPILAATLCTGERCTLTNCPDIRDVHTAIAILRALGCAAAFDNGAVTVDASALCKTDIPPALARKMRSSVTFLGPLLAAVGIAQVPLPGGCVLGKRPLDLHLSGLEALGVSTSLTENGVCCRGPVRGGTALLRYPSVGATENLLLAACGAKGPVTIIGAAREPEIADLAGFLRTCGAEITGAGSSVLRILSGPRHGCEYRILPDRMAAATYLCAAQASGGDLRLTGIDPGLLSPVTAALSAAGAKIVCDPDSIRLQAGPLHAISPIVTGPYPGFPTDAQAPVMAALLRAEGVTLVQETVFENRFRHVPALQKLGAKIRVCGSLAVVQGVDFLRGAEMEATDLRGGAAMLIAALGAEGESRIHAAEHIGRGYEHLCENLIKLGADVTEVLAPGSGC